ncbi:hypothetical protein ACLQ29_16675 [Micromonospora sp. DT228]|uniref:hypothetical protein n=1 Tax=Micromonospora sp. DT228 TaxID=3393443 RepID=UPI003CF1DEF2
MARCLVVAPVELPHQWGGHARGRLRARGPPRGCGPAAWQSACRALAVILGARTEVSAARASAAPRMGQLDRH